MTDFFRVPHTPHLAWLGKDTPRDDKVLSAAEAAAFLTHAVVLEEKVDGANLGFSVGDDGKVRAQNRGQYLMRPCKGQFSRLNGWLAMHEETMLEVLGDHLMLFGHNEAITNFVNKYGNIRIDNVSTSGFVNIIFDTVNWNTLENGTTQKVIFPSDLK